MGQIVSMETRASVPPTRVHLYAALRDAIVRGELEPGRQLSENELAERFGVSRTPVREALARLRDDRLVEIAPQLGTFVSRISHAAVADAQFVREALECAAVRRAAERASEDEIAELELNLQGQERVQESGDHDAFYTLDDGFHRSLCDASGHRAVWAISERAKSHLNRVRRLSLPITGYLDEMVNEHRAVAAAVAEHDPDAAEAALCHHLRMVLRELPRLRKSYPAYFDDLQAP